ncbi:transporter [Mesorhizobium sp. LSJC265A00]|uniref:carbohydrate ABC transporter permease n=2 Tax=Mesorhizobium sp. LSJC265A00 TaxID=1287322 RepID=UPI0003CF3B28|nr:carbohydrate ABC transporter permease [Mesorhizobium sp. LSJC265A00]ESX03092.1 transporter [Mesorhizobium sp. LSJC265A00]
MIDQSTNRAWKSFAWAVLLVAVVVALTPYVWMVLASFKNRVDLLSSVPKWIFSPTLANYPAVFIDKEYWPLAINSVLISVVSSTILCIVIGAPAAYGFARSDFPGREDLFFFFLTTRMAPPISIAVPLFLFFTSLGLIDTIYAVVIAHTSFNLSLVVWMMRGFFAEIPREIDEAAMMDGRSRLGAFFFVVAPLAAPGIGATAVLCFILSWNEFLYAFILVAFDGRPLTVGIPGLVTPHGTLWGQVAAVAIVATLPIVLFTFLVQKQLVRGLTFGAVKG